MSTFDLASSVATLHINMPSLLSLPLELREYIIAFAITSSTPSIDPANPGATKEHLDLDYTSRIGGVGLQYSYAQPKHKTSPSGLLGTNRQLHDETLHTLERIKAQDGYKYALDMTLANEEIIYASWSNIPPRSRIIDELAITINIHGTSIDPIAHNGFMDQVNGSTGPAIWRLYSILERFFRCGADESESRNEDKRLAVKTIDINILTPKGTDLLLAPADISLDRLCEYRAATPPHNHLMHPDALAKFMYVWVEGILRLCDPRYAVPGSPIAKYGKMFLQRIEVMRLRVDGVEKRVIDILEWVKELKEKEEQLRREEREVAEFEAASRAAFTAVAPVDLGAWTELEPVPEVTEEEELQAVAEEGDADPEGTALLAEILADNGVPDVLHPEDIQFAEILAEWEEAGVVPDDVFPLETTGTEEVVDGSS